MAGQYAEQRPAEAPRRLDPQGRTPAPFFVWLHLYDPHEPYRPPPPFRDAFADAPYDGEIAFDDAIVAAVLDRLQQLGLRDSTLVVIAGDHGESLGDHGEETHSMFVYEPVLRVPLILWKPGLVPAGRVVQDPVRLTDVAPTVLDLAGFPTADGKDARSLVRLVQGRKDDAPPPIYAETLLPQFYMNWSPLRSIHDDRWKLIEAPRPELYDLATDPSETHNQYADRPQTVRSLEQALARLTGGDAGAMTTATMDRETLEKLASLGYVGAGAEPAADGSQAPRPDPKDMVAVFNRLRQANSAVRDRRFAEALPILREVLSKDPRNAFAQLVLGSAHMGMGEYREAIAQYRDLPRAGADQRLRASVAVHLLHPSGRPGQRAARGRGDARHRQAVHGRPDHEGRGSSRHGGTTRARCRSCETAVEADPAKPMVRLDLAKVLAEAGQAQEAQEPVRGGAGGAAGLRAGAHRARCVIREPWRVRAGRGGAAARAGNRAARCAGTVQPGEGVRAARARPRRRGRSTRRWLTRRQRDAGDARGRAPGDSLKK